MESGRHRVDQWWQCEAIETALRIALRCAIAKPARVSSGACLVLGSPEPRTIRDAALELLIDAKPPVRVVRQTIIDGRGVSDALHPRRHRDGAHVGALALAHERRE
jgi:hypothetical protein